MQGNETLWNLMRGVKNKKQTELEVRFAEGSFVLTPIRGVVHCRILYMLIMAKLFVVEQLFLLFTNEYHVCCCCSLD